MKKTRFVLSRKNQKGQVAIFVALIFQVIFVFFALLINVGLLVHHKINLQQSTDLAAYYGAMKQAESLNAIAHINFQIKQAWKLLTWRYRVVGTFGFQPNDTTITFPLKLGPAGTTPGIINGANSNNNSGKCTVDSERLNTNDLPFFCVGHPGIKGWPNADQNLCIINCGQLDGGAKEIMKIMPVGNANTPYGGNVAGAVGAAITKANQTLDLQCNDLGPTGMQVLARFLASYYLEEKARSSTLLMLAANMSNSEQEQILDLDGNLVLDGVKKTLRYNLTEANAVSLVDSKIKIINGLSNENCRMTTDAATSGSKKGSGQFLKRIEFSFLQFYIHKCFPIPGVVGTDPGKLSYKPGSIFDISGQKIDTNLNPGAGLNDLVMALELNDNHKFTVGYEKNPWCQSYYTVKAESEPKIPFLPISKIKLTAVSTAKPFGGSIGPWFGKEWKAGDSNSQDAVGVDTAKQLDATLPLVAASATSTLKENIKKLPNFSRYVGDNLGLSDGNYLAEYHAALVERQPSSSSVNYGGSKQADNGNGSLSVPHVWPALDAWNDAALSVSDNNYDPMVKGPNKNDSYLRDLEISAISPNQFDLTYYSIDPDYYNNYYLRISKPDVFSNLKKSAGNLGPDDVAQVRPDFGNNANIYPNQKAFGVRNQIEIVAKTFKSKINALTSGSGIFLDSYKEVATRQSSLLTGWTFFSLADYGKFPDADVTSADGSMTFGRCRDAWQGSDGAPDYKTPLDIDKDLPPTPGNCVTGGRVGYSVKLVSPSLLRGNAPPQPLGGVNTSGQIINPIPDSFFNF